MAAADQATAMEVDTPNNSIPHTSHEKPLEYVEEDDIVAKMFIAYRIFHACKKNISTAGELNKNDHLQSALHEIYKDYEFVTRRKDFKRNPKMSFSEYMRNRQSLETKEFPQDKLRLLLRMLYILPQNFARKTHAIEELKSTALTKMIKFDYNTYRPGAAFLIENPEITYKRVTCLNRIIEYRKIYANFTYMSYMEDNFAIVISPFKDFMCTADNKQDRTHKIIKLQNLIPILPKGSVVFVDSRDLQETSPLPNQFSTKSAMKAWLIAYDIPFDNGAHTAELYALIQKFKHKHKHKSQVRNLLESNGFTVIETPDLKSLSYFHQVDMDLEKIIRKRANSIRSIVGDVHAIENALVLNETLTLTEDLEMENKTEQIREAAKLCFKGTKRTGLLSSIPTSEYDPYRELPFIITSK